MNDQLLRQSLGRIGDDARPADLLDRSLARSRQIGRRQTVGTAAAVLLLLVGGGVAVAQSVRPSPRVVTPVVTPSPSTATPVAGSIAGLPGWLYYTDPDSAHVLRLTRTGPRTVLTTGGYTATVSPDGTRLAYVDDSGTLTVSDRDGGHRRSLLPGSPSDGYEPSWTGDSRTVIGAKDHTDKAADVGTVSVETGKFTPLPHPIDGVHPRWSADGRHLIYDTGDGRVVIADADGANRHVVPLLGAESNGRRSADVFSVSPDATLIALDEVTGDAPEGDPARNGTANAVVDTRTGKDVALPVPGTITAVLFQPDGHLLVRSKHADKSVHLTLLAADRSIVADVTEPRAVGTYQLLAYTPS